MLAKANFHSARHKYITEVIIAVFIVCVAIIARLTRINHAFWKDEAFNVFVSHAGISHALELIRQDFFPPLYNILLYFWLEGGAKTEYYVRLLSISAGIASIFLVFLISRQYFDNKTAFVAAALVAISPIHALWSQVARPFALEILFVLAVVLFTYELGVNKKRGWWWFLWFMSCILALYTSHGAFYQYFYQFLALCCLEFVN